MNRLLPTVAIAVTSLFFAGTAIADEPVPTFAELYKEYLALGLPLPPKTAKLMRSSYGGTIKNGVLHPGEESLGFVSKPGSFTEPTTAFYGIYEVQPRWLPHLREAKPDASALEGMSKPFDPFINPFILSFQCQSRGWDELARKLYEASQKDQKAPPMQRKWDWGYRWDWGGEKPKISPMRQLRQWAWWYWDTEGRHSSASRETIANRLKELISKEPSLNTEENRSVLKGSELATAPSKAKPGSVEAMIDELVDYRSDCGNSVGFYFHPEEGYLRIAALGFDAVPALIEHLEDGRYTRAMVTGGMDKYWRTRNVQISDIAGELLERIANKSFMRSTPVDVKEVQGGFSWLEGYPIKKSEVEEWWEKARKAGEEKYLLDHVLPEFDFVNEHMLYILSVESPKQIPILYKTVLEKREEKVVFSDKLAQVLCKTTIPKNEKLELLLQGAKHVGQRYGALSVLKSLDNESFNSLLIEAIGNLPKERPDDFEETQGLWIVNLVIGSDDARAWQALQKVMKGMAVGLRMEFLENFRDWDCRSQRVKRLRFLESFMDDGTVRDSLTDRRYKESNVGNSFKKIEVRNYVALKIALDLQIDIEVENDASPEEWARNRECIRGILKKELEGQK